MGGYIIGQVVADQAEVLTFAVLPYYRRQGRGRALLGYFLQQLRRRGVTHVMLEVAADNLAARTLYQDHGFMPSGVRPAYYKRPDGECDAITMRCCFAEAFS
jgi:ribosomal-protein-alanine N-acetyltransferase